MFFDKWRAGSLYWCLVFGDRSCSGNELSPGIHTHGGLGGGKGGGVGKRLFLAWHELGVPWAICWGCFLACHVCTLLCAAGISGKDLFPDLEEETITEANINPIHTGLDILQDPLAEYPKTQKVLMLSTLMGLTMTNPSRWQRRPSLRWMVSSDRDYRKDTLPRTGSLWSDEAVPFLNQELCVRLRCATLELFHMEAAVSPSWRQAGQEVGSPVEEHRH